MAPDFISRKKSKQDLCALLRLSISLGGKKLIFSRFSFSSTIAWLLAALLSFALSLFILGKYFS